MGIKVLISSARKCKEKEEIKKLLERYPDVEQVYDCNDTPTDYNRDETKQEEIDNYIRHRTDWFIFLCPYEFVGQVTFHELQEAVAASRSKFELPMVSIFFSADPEEELRLRNEQLEAAQVAPIRYDSQHDMIRSEIMALLNPDPARKHYLPDPYEHGQLIECVQKEYERFVRNGLRMRRFETFCSDIQPTDIFYDPNRAKEENGFTPDYFLPLDHYRQMLEQGTNHLLLCGPPASGKTRSVYEYLRSWGRDPKRHHVFISVRAARNLGAGQDGHHCISLRELVSELKAYDAYLKAHPICKVESHERHFIVIDQVDAMIGDDFLLLRELFEEATSALRPDYQILLTTTPSGYERSEATFSDNQNVQYTNNDYQSTLPLRRIDIAPLSAGDASRIWRDMTADRSDMAVMPKGTVVGDFIPKFRQYHERLLDEARRFACALPAVRLPHGREPLNAVGAFVRSVQVVKRMRRSHAIPLCLCLMYMEQMLWELWGERYRRDEFLQVFSSDVLKVMKEYFVEFNILQLDFGHDASPAEGLRRGKYARVASRKDKRVGWLVMGDLDFEQVRVYDNEEMETIVSPDITLSFVNDKMWDELEQLYQFDYKIITLPNGNRTASLHAREEAEEAMDIWYDTFAYYGPWSTLLRMLTRSPLIPLDKLQKRVFDYSGKNNATFVEEKFRKTLSWTDDMSEAEKREFLGDPNRCFLERLLTASKGRVEDIRREVYCNGKVVESYLNYSFVGELYKRAYDRAQNFGYHKPIDEKMARQMQERQDKGCRRKEVGRVDEYIQLADELLRALEARPEAKRPAETEERLGEFYFYSRKILQCDTFNEAYNTYFAHTDLATAMAEISDRYNARPKEDAPLSYAQKACAQIMSSMCALILGDFDFDNWMKLARQTHTEITLWNVMQLVTRSNANAKHSELQRKLFEQIIRVSDRALRQGDNRALADIMRANGVKVVCKMIEQAPSLMAARKIEALAEPWLTDGLVVHTNDTLDIWENVALGRLQPYEYPFLLREITADKMTGELKERWVDNEKLRDTLLFCPSNLSDTFELYCRLYENTDKARERQVTPYTIANFFRNVSRKYKHVKGESINSAFEAFMQMMTYPKMRHCVKRIIADGEIGKHNFLLDVYNSVVTRRQEQWFIDFLGQNVWEQMCLLPKVNFLRICKERIYSVDEVITILEDVVREQKRYAVIGDDLVNNAVTRLQNTPKGKEHDKLYGYLYSLLTEDRAYVEALVKTENFYRSCLELNVPVVYPHAFHAKQDYTKAGRGCWYKSEQLEQVKSVNEALHALSREKCVDREYAQDKFPVLLADMRALKGTQVVPNIADLLYVLKNVVRDQEDRDGKKKTSVKDLRKRNMQPGNLLEIVRCCYTGRGLPVTTTVVNALLEGFVNYYGVSKRPQDKELVRQYFWRFVHDEAPYVRLDALSYKHILTLWPGEAERHEERISRLADCNEQLMNILVKKRLLPYVADWQTRWQEHLLIVGQKQ